MSPATPSPVPQHKPSGSPDGFLVPWPADLSGSPGVFPIPQPVNPSGFPGEFPVPQPAEPSAGFSVPRHLGKASATQHLRKASLLLGIAKQYLA